MTAWAGSALGGSRVGRVGRARTHTHAQGFVGGVDLSRATTSGPCADPAAGGGRWPHRPFPSQQTRPIGPHVFAPAANTPHSPDHVCLCFTHTNTPLTRTYSPLLHTQGFVVGAGLSGVATSGLSLIAQLQATSDGGGDRSAADVAPAAFTYFGAATAIIVLCVLTYMVLPRLDYSRAKLAPYLMSECRGG